MTRTAILAVAWLILAGSGPAHAQDGDELSKLKERNELLERSLKRAEDEIERLKKEIERLKVGKVNPQKPGGGIAPADDLFAVGSILSGSRGFAPLRPGAPPSQDLKLVITKRERGTFEGDLTITPRDPKFPGRTVKVTGTAPTGKSGMMRFTSEKQGKFQVTFTGSLNGGEAGLTFAGPDYEGRQVSGTATLRKEK